jgi:hypothetical protein
MVLLKIIKPIKQRFTGFMMPFKEFSAEKWELFNIFNFCNRQLFKLLKKYGTNLQRIELNTRISYILTIIFVTNISDIKLNKKTFVIRNDLFPQNLTFKNKNSGGSIIFFEVRKQNKYNAKVI